MSDNEKAISNYNNNEINDLQNLLQESGVEISLHEEFIDFQNSNYFSKLELSNKQKMSISGLFQAVPSTIAANSLSKAYSAKFPPGATASNLIQYRNGGVGSPILKNGSIESHASFYSLSTQATVLAIFNVMSVITGQYFLSKINNELDMINFKLDKILEFLYGEKKAELLSEISFIKYAYNNYESIMQNEAQRIATIQSIQSAKKVAIKDIEFYMQDVSKTIDQETNNLNDFASLTNKFFQLSNSLELSFQLYVMSSLSEISFAQNYDIKYLNYLEEDILYNIDKHNKYMWGKFGRLQDRNYSYKANTIEKITKKTIDKSEYEKQVAIFEKKYQIGQEPLLYRPVKDFFKNVKMNTEYLLTESGDVYIKNQDKK